jgi:hypothetical protein
VNFRVKAASAGLAAVLCAVFPLKQVNNSQNALQAITEPGEVKMKNSFHRVINLLAKPIFINNIQLHLANKTISR